MQISQLHGFNNLRPFLDCAAALFASVIYQQAHAPGESVQCPRRSSQPLHFDLGFIDQKGWRQLVK
jgi:hypothetical protein